MVQINTSLLIATLFASTGLAFAVSGTGSKFMVRDFIESGVFSRELETAGLFTRGEIEQLFDRELDSEWSFLAERDLLDSEWPSLTERDFQEIHAHDPPSLTDFFRSIGEFVKRMASDYWAHMIRKAHLELREEDDGKRTFPRDFDFDDYELVERATTSWFGKALVTYRDKVLPPDSDNISERDTFNDNLWLEERWNDHQGREFMDELD